LEAGTKRRPPCGETRRFVVALSGRYISVDSGSDDYWVDHRGVVLGTDVDTSPGVDFRRLPELSPR
jgi:hypothetical protein